MPLIGGIFIGFVYFVFSIACNGRYSFGTLWPAHAAFAPLAHFTAYTREIEFYGGPLLYVLYAAILWHALRKGWGHRALLELAILHYVCFAFLIPNLIDDDSFSDQLKYHRINLWLLGVVAAFFFYVHVVAFRFATGRSVRNWMPVPRFSLRTAVAGMLLLASAITLWINRDPWVLQATLKGHNGGAEFAAFSSDGKQIISVSRGDGTMRTWDADTGHEIKSCEPHMARQQKIIATANGPILAALGPDNFNPPPTSAPETKLDSDFAETLRRKISFESAVKNLDEAIKSLKETGRIQIEVKDEGERWSEFENTIKVSNIELKDALEMVAKTAFVKIEYKESSVVFIAQSELNRVAAAKQQVADETVKVWNLERNELFGSLYMPGAVEFLLSSDAKQAVTWNSDGEVWFWDIPSGAAIFKIPAEWQLGSMVNFSPDGELASVSILNGQNEELPVAMLLNLRSGKILRRIHFDNEYRPPSAVWRKDEFRFTKQEFADLSQDGERFISSSGRMLGNPMICDAHNDNVIAECELNVNAMKSMFFPDGERVATFESDMAVIWDARTGRELAKTGEWKWISVWNDFSDYFRFFDDRNIANPFDMSSGSQIGQISKDGERLLIADVTYEPVELPSLGRRQFLAPGDAIQSLKVWRRRRPEWWWGYAWLPEFWVCAAFACAFGWSALRDIRRDVPAVKSAA